MELLAMHQTSFLWQPNFHTTRERWVLLVRLSVSSFFAREEKPPHVPFTSSKFQSIELRLVKAWSRTEKHIGFTATFAVCLFLKPTTKHLRPPNHRHSWVGIAKRFLFVYYLGSITRNSWMQYSMRYKGNITTADSVNLGTFLRTSIIFGAVHVQSRQNYWQTPWMNVVYWRITVALTVKIVCFRQAALEALLKIRSKEHAENPHLTLYS